MRNEQNGFAGRYRRLYKIWHSMKDRCNNKNNNQYHRYGGRGISICQEWGSTLQPFVEWALQNGYQDNLTIDRIDVNGNYEPSNCRWATKKQQERNRRDNVLYEHNGEKHCLPEWAQISGISRNALVMRVTKMNWPMERALTQPVQIKVRRK